MRKEQQGGEQLPKQLFLGYTPTHKVWAKFMIFSSAGNFNDIFSEVGKLEKFI